jgi:serine/threonine-protein kinase
MAERTIGQYQVLDKLGSGGMGEILKAQDPRLNRFVAIKSLNESGADDPERRRRFAQEAQAASALNHPNIITIYDILSEGGTDYIVMEFVTGQTLADRIPREGLGVAKTLQYGVQIADALRAAHAAGIVHRDLKPGNVMITDSGLVKVLDFGLAKLSVQQLSEETQTLNAMTVEGSILGTVSYMSPEQAQGLRVDARSDIFSFGALMYEMVTGHKAFAGESTISTIASILRDQVKPISDLAGGVPAELEEVIGRSLRKDPADRWQTMEEAFQVLAALKQKFDSGILTHTQFGPARPPAVNAKAPRKNKMLIWGSVIAAAILAEAAGWWWVSHRNPTPLKPVAANPIPGGPVAAPPPGTVLTNQDVIAMAKAHLSPSLIISQIRSSETRFDLSTPEVIRLTKEGLPEKVIEVMRNPKAAAGTDMPSPFATPDKSSPPEPAPATPSAPVPPPAVGLDPGVVALHPITILGGLPLGITLLQEVPAGAEPGTALRFQVTRDYFVNGQVVIAQGAPVTGELLGAGKKFLSLGGKVQFKLNTVTAVDGHKLQIKASPGRHSDKNEQRIEPPGHRNKDVLAPAGSQYLAFFDGDQTVNVRRGAKE